MTSSLDLNGHKQFCSFSRLLPNPNIPLFYVSVVLFSCPQGQKTCRDPLESDVESLSGSDSSALSQLGINQDYLAQCARSQGPTFPLIMSFPQKFLFSRCAHRVEFCPSDSACQRSKVGFRAAMWKQTQSRGDEVQLPDVELNQPSLMPLQKGQKTRARTRASRSDGTIARGISSARTAGPMVFLKLTGL